MFNIRKKIRFNVPVTLDVGDKLKVTHQLIDQYGVVHHEEVLIEDHVQEGETETYTHGLIIGFEDELGFKKGYVGGVAKEEK